MSEAEIRKAIIEKCIKMYNDGLTQGTGGNVSVRTEDGFLLTPSGMDYFRTEPSDLVKMSYDGNVISGERTPSIEKDMHRLILNARSDINAVVHTHSVYATAVASTRRGIPPITDNQVVIFGGEIPVAEYGRIGTEELAENVVKGLGDGKAVLMSNHGVLAVGKTLEEAVFNAEMTELFARIYILSSTIGGGRAFTEEEIKAEHDDVNARYGQKK